jgi:hypothetical protein
MEAVEELTVLPALSWTVTVMAGVMAAPAAALVGWVVKANLLAEPIEISKGLLIALVSPKLEAFRV